MSDQSVTCPKCGHKHRTIVDSIGHIYCVCGHDFLATSSLAVAENQAPKAPAERCAFAFFRRDDDHWRCALDIGHSGDHRMPESAPETSSGATRSLRPLDGGAWKYDPIYKRAWFDGVEYVPKELSVSFSEGKRIYDQGWNDGLDYFRKTAELVLAARSR